MCLCVCVCVCVCERGRERERERERERDVTKIIILDLYFEEDFYFEYLIIEAAYSRKNSKMLMLKVKGKVIITHKFLAII